MKHVNRFLNWAYRGLHSFVSWFKQAVWWQKLITVAGTILVILLIIGGVQYARDYAAGYDTFIEQAVVTGKHYTPPRTRVYTTYNSQTKSTQVHTQHIPADYDVFCRGELDTYSFDVGRKFFEYVAEGDTLYVIGRIGGHSGKCLRMWPTTDLESQELDNGTVEDLGW
jgi:hypothetical protein